MAQTSSLWESSLKCPNGLLFVNSVCQFTMWISHKMSDSADFTRNKWIKIISLYNLVQKINICSAQRVFWILTQKRDLKKHNTCSTEWHFCLSYTSASVFVSPQGETFPSSFLIEAFFHSVTQLWTAGWVWTTWPREFEDILIGYTGSAERTAAVQSARSAL